MARVLSAAHARIHPGRESAYLETLAALARELRARGESVWLFRHPSEPDRFLECTETSSPERHRLLRSRDPEEVVLEERLRSLARYETDAAVLWEEVPLSPRTGE